MKLSIKRKGVNFSLEIKKYGCVPNDNINPLPYSKSTLDAWLINPAFMVNNNWYKNKIFN